MFTNEQMINTDIDIEPFMVIIVLLFIRIKNK